MMGGRWSLRKLGAAIGVGASLVVPWATTGTPSIPVQSGELRDEAHTLARLVREFGIKLPHVFLGLKDEARFVQAQLVHERIADIAIDLYVASCVVSRLDHLLSKPRSNGQATDGDPFADVAAGRYFLKMAFRRIRERFAALDDSDDSGLLESARSMLGRM
jgi:hypothetical protein